MTDTSAPRAAPLTPEERAELGVLLNESKDVDQINFYSNIYVTDIEGQTLRVVAGIVRCEDKSVFRIYLPNALNAATLINTAAGNSIDTFGADAVREALRKLAPKLVELFEPKVNT